MNDKDFYWLIGMIEGEGCFTWDKNRYRPQVSCNGTDEDTISRVASLFGVKYHQVYTKRQQDNGYKPLFATKIVGSRALKFMDECYEHMSLRRQGRINELRELYEARPKKRRPYPLKSPYNR